MASDLKSRVGTRTGGNANLLSVKGELISGDGEQAVYLEPGINGLFLMRDDTAREGVSWQAPGGGPGVTGSDGVTVAANNATNDLVTGTPVAAIDAQVTGDIGIVGIGADSDVTIISSGAAGDITINSAHNLSTHAVNTTTIDSDGLTTISGSGVRVQSDAGTQVFLTSGNNMFQTIGGTWTVAFGNGATITGDPNAGFGLTTQGTGDITVTSGDNESHVVGGDFTVAAAAGGIVLDTTGLATPAVGEIDVIADSLANIVGGTGVSISGLGNSTVSIGSGVDGPVNITTLGTGDITLNKSATGATITLGTGIADAGITIQATSAGGGILVEASGAAASVVLNGTDGVNIQNEFTRFGTAGGLNSFIQADGSVGDLTISGGAGATQTLITITGTTGVLTLDAPDTLLLQPGNDDFAIFDAAVGAPQHAPIADAAGGAVQDTEARAALNTLLNAMRNWGWIATT